MFPTKNDLPKDIRTKMVELLNARLADAFDLHSQAKQAHWNVKGATFIALHKLFDEVAEAAEDYIDDIAERAVQLGGVAEGTVRAAAKKTTLPDYPLNISSPADHVKAMTASLASLAASTRKAIDLAAEVGDADTADLFTEVSRGLDKWLWFVEAHAM